MKKKFNFLFIIAVIEFIIIFYLLSPSRYEPKYAGNFQGDMQIELRQLAKEIFSSKAIKDDKYYNLKELKLSKRSMIILRKYNIHSIIRESDSVYFIINSWIDDYVGIVYSESGKPAWIDIKSMKALGNNFFGFSSMY